MCGCGGGGTQATLDTTTSGPSSITPASGGMTFMGKSLLFWLVVAILIVAILTYSEVSRG